MRIIRSGVVLAALMAAFGAMADEMPPNSYLVRPAGNHQALLKQTTGDPVVLDRYMRHFAMSKAEVVDYFKTLHLVKIPSDMVFVVYNVPKKTGELRSRILKLKKGTKIWVDGAGHPVLKEECGNPLTKGPLKPEAVNISTLIEKQAPPTEGEIEIIPSEEVVASVAPVEPEIPTVVVEAVTPPEPAPPTVTVGESNIPVIGAPWWLGIPILGGAIAIIPKGGGDRPPPVPEPTSFLALGLGAGAFGATLYRHRNRR